MQAPARLASGFDTGSLRAMAATAPPRPILTPCIKVCVMDDESGLCLGCFRTLPEVAAWSQLGEAERAAVMAELPSRRGRIRPEKLG
jgi:predicted Fe-S protein YdhL (DUF1289 family)